MIQNVLNCWWKVVTNGYQDIVAEVGNQFKEEYGKYFTTFNVLADSIGLTYGYDQELYGEMRQARRLAETTRHNELEVLESANDQKLVDIRTQAEHSRLADKRKADYEHTKSINDLCVEFEKARFTPEYLELKKIERSSKITNEFTGLDNLTTLNTDGQLLVEHSSGRRYIR